MGSIGEKHLSRLASPKSWDVKKKGLKWIARPLPGAHSFKNGIHLISIFRDLLNYAKNTKEVKKILNREEIYIDGKRRKNPRFIVGLMDVLFIPKTKEYFRVLLTEKGKITLIPINEKEAQFKPCKIINKTPVKKKIQLNLSDGKNILVEKTDYKVGDTLLVNIPSLKIKEHIPSQKGCSVYLIGGKHTGLNGNLEEVKDKTVILKKGNELIKTSKKYMFVVGKTKPLIKL